MGKIKKILENELVGGTQTTDVYPVTSIKAVYDENNERLDNIINRRGVVNISTNYNSDHIAEVLTLSKAINKVPTKDRVLGFEGRILTEDGWRNYTFVGSSISDWNNLSMWVLPHTTSLRVMDVATKDSLQDTLYKYVKIDSNKNSLQYLPAIKELYLDISEYTTPEVPIYLRGVYRDYTNEQDSRHRWVIQFTRNNTSSEYVCSTYYYDNIENNEVLVIRSSNTYGKVNGYIVIDWDKFPIGAALVEGLVLESSFNLKNSPTIYGYIQDKLIEEETKSINNTLNTKKSGISYIDENKVYLNNIVKELYIDKTKLPEGDIHIKILRRGYTLNNTQPPTWVMQFRNESGIVCQFWSRDLEIESNVVNVLKDNDNSIVGYVVIDWNNLETDVDYLLHNTVLEDAFNIKNSPIINSYINNTSLQNDLKNQEDKINLIKSSPIFINEKTVLYNNAIKELYIDKTNYIGSKPIYVRGVYRGYVSDSNPRIRWIIQFTVGDSTSIVCQYQYDSTDESQLILPITSSGNFGDVTGYIILDWNQFADGRYTHVNKELTEAAFNIKNSPIIKEYIDNKQLQEENWKEYPTLNVFEKGYLPNSGNGFALLSDRGSNISYSVHPKVLDKSNNINTKFSVYISMLEDEAGNITEDSVLYLFNSVLKTHNYNRIWLALGASLYFKIGRRDSGVSYENCANGHVVTIPDEDVNTLGLSSNKAAIWYPLSWHNKLMASSEYKPYIQVYNGNTINDSEEGTLYKYEIDWRNEEAVSLFEEMLSTVSSAFNNKAVNGIILRKYISVMEISFINNWGEGSLTSFGTKIPEYDNLDCLKQIVEYYKQYFPKTLLTAPALSMQDRYDTYTDAMKDFAVYLATTSGNDMSKELGVFMDNVGFYSSEYTLYTMRHNGIYILDRIKEKREQNKGIYIGELANTMGWWRFELKNDHLPYSIKKLGLSMYNHDIRYSESYIIQTGINYIELMKDCYDKAGYRFYLIGNRSYYKRSNNTLSVNAIFWIGNMGYANLYHKFWKPYIVVRTEDGSLVSKILLTNLDLTKINHSDWNVGVEYTTPYRKLNMSVDVTSYPTNTKFDLFFAIEDSDNISDNMCLSITGRNNNNEYLIYNEGYNIIYNTYDGVNSEFNPTQYYPCRENVKLFPATHDSKIFMGWYLDAGFENKITEIDVSNNRGDINLYAKFS